MAVYALVGPTWELNVLNVHVPFRDATTGCVHHIMEAYRRMAIKGPTIVIGDFNSAPTKRNIGGELTPKDEAVCIAVPPRPPRSHCPPVRPTLPLNATTMG